MYTGIIVSSPQSNERGILQSGTHDVIVNTRWNPCD